VHNESLRVDPQVILFYCGSGADDYPQQSENWLQGNCNDFVRNRNVSPALDGVVYETRAPKDADLPVRRTGWYMGCMSLRAYDFHSGELKDEFYGFYFTPPAWCEPGGCTTYSSAKAALVAHPQR
jgi:hypothetical protein